MDHLRFTTGDGSPPFMGVPPNQLHAQGLTSSPFDVALSPPGANPNAGYGNGPPGYGGYMPGPNGPYGGSGYPGYPGYGAGYPQGCPPAGVMGGQPPFPPGPYNQQPMQQQPMQQQPFPDAFGPNGPYWPYYPPGNRRENAGQTISSTTVELTSASIGNVFPSAMATVHVVEASTPPWENPGGSFKWRPHRAPTSMKIKELIEQLCPDSGPDGKKITSRGVAECLENGDGSWLKATEFWVGEKGSDDNMKRRIEQSIGEVGWNETRGKDNRPVWLSCVVAYE